jgi:eukaryotic-like serine/threonine-protein kinase
MDPGSSSMRLLPGQIVSGKYRVIRLIGDGGMGSVYEAHHEVLGARVALKLLHPELASMGAMTKRFLQEARASARIKSQHVVRVSDADQTPEGMAFIVLEFVEGQTLGELYQELAREGKKLPFADALDFAMQMFEGAEAAHEAGIIHRDLKPDNVMVTKDSKGRTLLKLLDFGIAKVDEPHEMGGMAVAGGPLLTRPGSLLGTPEYMAPEQVYSAATADARSDVFSLGVILFEMLSGRRPVLSDDPQQIAVAYLTGAFTRLEEASPGVPGPLAVAVHRALMAQPRDRFASVAELRDAIEPFAAPFRASTSSLSISDLSSAGSSRGIPETRSDPSIASTAAPQPAPDAAAQPAPDAAAAVPAGFTPEYPPVGVPISLWTPHPTNSTGAPVRGSYPPPPVPMMPMSGQPPVFTMTGPGSWIPPVPVASPEPPRSSKGLWIVIVIAVLLVAGGVTAAVLYYGGWLDDPEPTKPHRGPRPHPTATHRPASLR